MAIRARVGTANLIPVHPGDECWQDKVRPSRSRSPRLRHGFVDIPRKTNASRPWLNLWPQLNSLTVVMCIHDFRRFLDVAPSLLKLNITFSELNGNCSAEDLNVCFTSIARRMPGIKDLYFFTEDTSGEVDQLGALLDADRRLSGGSLEPLKSLQSLETLVIKHLLPFSLSSSEFEELVRCWPRLLTIDLSSTPFKVDTEKCGLSLDALHILAAHCPRLEYLALFFCCTKAFTPKVSTDDGDPLMLEHLKQFAPGNSDFNSEPALTGFLACMFPPACAILPGKFDITISPEDGDPEDIFNAVAVIEKNQSAWFTFSHELLNIFELRRLTTLQMNGLKSQLALQKRRFAESQKL